MGHVCKDYLDSQKLEDAANELNTYIDKYIKVLEAIEVSTNTLLENWHGEGCKEFEKDYTTLYQQLTDISDVMYNLYDSLVSADSTYVETDEEIGKSLATGE